MSFVPQTVPKRFLKIRTLLFRPSAFEQDPAFRHLLTKVVHAGLRWGSIVAFLGLVLYVGIEIVGLGRPVRWFHEAGYTGEEVALVEDLLLMGLCLASAFLPETNCSLNQCRAWAAGALLVGVSVFLRSDIIQGTVEFEFVALLYLLVVVIVPFRPWQIVSLGGGIGGILVGLDAGVLWVPPSAAAAFEASELVPSLGYATLLATLVGTLLYGIYLTQYRERQEAQHALRRSRDLLQRTQEVAGVGGWEYDADADALRGTENMYEILSLPHDVDLDLELFVGAFAPRVHSELRGALRHCVEERQSFEREFPRPTTDGEVRWIRVRGAVRSTDGSPAGTFRVAGTVQDVTQRREMEEQLREREEWLRSITENVPDGICRSDPDEGLVYANHAFARMFGFEEPTEALNTDPTDLYADPDAQSRIDHVEARRHDSEGVEVEFQRRDGSTFTGLLNRTEVLDEDGNVQYYDAIVTDITDQKEREKGRQKRREKVEALYTATGQLLREENPECVADRVRRLVAEEFGCSFGDVLFVEGEKLVWADTDKEGGQESMRPPVDLNGDSMPARAYRSGETVSVSSGEAQQVLRGDGDLRALAFVPMDTHGLVAIGSFEDEGLPSFDLRLLEILATYAAAVLDRIEREQRLITAKEDAEEANRLKSAMLANMSHEIRTPLTAINGFAEILKEEAPEPHADLAGRIYRSGERLLQTLTSLVQLSKLEAGVTDLDRESVQLDQAARETVSLLRPRAQEKPLTIETETPASPVIGAWNEGAVNRILSNLLENAIKFTSKGGRVCVRVTETSHEGILVVEDTGIGMSEAFQEVAFDAFKQESEGKDRSYEGTGLGLPIVQRLVQALGGSIELDSTKGEGTRFTVRLPRQEVPAGAEANAFSGAEEEPGEV